MSTKIFPFRKLNPNKGRIDIPNAPSRQPSTSEEDRAIMRELLKEAALAELDKRVEKLPKPSLSIVAPQLTDVHFYYPEVIVAFAQVSRPNKNALARKPKYKWIKEAAAWLKVYQTGVHTECIACNFDITVLGQEIDKNDTVPYEIVIVGKQPPVVGGLCLLCESYDMKAKMKRIIANLNLEVKS